MSRDDYLLSKPDKRDLKQYDKLVVKALKAKRKIETGFLELAESIFDIHRKKLYRVKYKTFAEFCEIGRKYDAIYHVQAAWKERMQEEALRTRKVRTPLGFTRTMYGSEHDIKKQAINTPIQGMIVHLINRAMINLENILEEKQMKSRLVLQIYDQLLFEVHPDELEEMKVLLRREMEKPIKIYDRDISFKVDVSVGKNFGEMEDLK